MSDSGDVAEWTVMKSADLCVYLAVRGSVDRWAFRELKLHVFLLYRACVWASLLGFFFYWQLLSTMLVQDHSSIETEFYKRLSLIDSCLWCVFSFQLSQKQTWWRMNENVSGKCHFFCNKLTGKTLIELSFPLIKHDPFCVLPLSCEGPVRLWP